MVQVTNGRPGEVGEMFFIELKPTLTALQTRIERLTGCQGRVIGDVVTGDSRLMTAGTRVDHSLPYIDTLFGNRFSMLLYDLYPKDASKSSKARLFLRKC